MTARHILLVNWNDRRNPYGGGAEIHLHELFGRLARAGHRVTYLCSGFAGAPREEMLDDMHVLRVGGRYTFNFVAPGAMKHWLRQNPCDLVVDALNKIPVYAPLYVDRPVLGIGHHLFGTTIFREVPPPLSLYVFATELAVPYVYRNVPMAVISESTRDDFVRRGLPREHIRVIYVGVDSDQYSPSSAVPRAEAPLLLALGRVRKYKRLDLVVDAVAAVGRSNVPDVKLVIAGEGNYLAALERHVARTGAKPYVEFRGRVSEEEKVELYRRAWAMIMTSPKEGWGLTCLEAQACGTPVIASDSPGLREAVCDDESGILVAHGDRIALRRAIDRVLSDAALRARLGAGALAFARTFSWTRAAEETMELVEATIAGGVQ